MCLEQQQNLDMNLCNLYLLGICLELLKYYCWFFQIIKKTQLKVNFMKRHWSLYVSAFMKVINQIFTKLQIMMTLLEFHLSKHSQWHKPSPSLLFGNLGDNIIKVTRERGNCCIQTDISFIQHKNLAL